MVMEDLIREIELHSVEGIKACFSRGISPNDYFRGEPLIFELTSEYTRTDRFKQCVRAFIDAGLEFEDRALLSVLSDQPELLHDELIRNPQLVSAKYTLRCAYTPLHEATLLHFCAEFNHPGSARILVQHGADINARAGIDADGFGGQTPVFHTVNQNSNHSAEMLNYLLSLSADLQITVPGLIWGKGYEWETLIPAVNPISYAMMGNLPQMHRDEATISKIVTILIRHAYGITYNPRNVPCAYLAKQVSGS
jgi:hypothetical protein